MPPLPNARRWERLTIDDTYSQGIITLIFYVIIVAGLMNCCLTTIYEERYQGYEI